jgi:uncharacterized protein
MKTIKSFPRKVREIPNLFIPLPDGTRLAARMWLPANADRQPVPALLEYLPYRKRDGTIVRDALTHPYLAGHGYACIRVDMRGNGDSDGIMLDEYAEQELADAEAVIAWLVQQPWCTGKVGMMGISWGGFNGLQVAARRPPGLKAIITLCSTDDRYSDDIHYKGACSMKIWAGRPPCLPTRPDRQTRHWSVTAGVRCGWRGCKPSRFWPSPGSNTRTVMPTGNTARCAKTSAPLTPQCWP